MIEFKEETLMEISKLKLVKEKWENLEPTLCFKWTEDLPPPYSDHDVEIDISRQDVIQLRDALNEYLEETRPLELKR